MTKRVLMNDFLAEQFALQILVNFYGRPGTHVTASNPQAPFDIKLGGKKYDVKYSGPTTLSAHRSAQNWDFSLRNKPKGSCDYFVLVAHDDKAFCAVYLVPESQAPMRHIRIPIHYEFSKWDEFKIWPSSA